jgi:23S rRNA U2552 (ribose-2'-O)-methylase RlmE/FtsJ
MLTQIRASVPRPSRLTRAYTGTSSSDNTRKCWWLAAQYKDKRAKRTLWHPDAYRSEEAFWLLDIQRQFNVGLDRDHVRSVLDLGAVSGSWSQVMAGLLYGRLHDVCGKGIGVGGSALEAEAEEDSRNGVSMGAVEDAAAGADTATEREVDDSAVIYAIDKNPIEPMPGVRTLELDPMAPHALHIVAELLPPGQKVDVILSNVYVDNVEDAEEHAQFRLFQHRLLNFARRHLCPVDEREGPKKRGILV